MGRRAPRRRAPAREGSAERARSTRTRGIALAAQGDQAGAIEELDAATQASQDPMLFLVTYAHWLGAWHDKDGALAKLRAARPPLAKDPGTLAAIGEEIESLGDFNDCVPTFDQAIGMKDAAESRTYRAVCASGSRMSRARRTTSRRPSPQAARGALLARARARALGRLAGSRRAGARRS